MRPTPPSAVAAMIVASVAVACGPEAGGSGWTAAVDTSGATVRVVNLPPAEGATPTRVADVELRIGSVGGAGPTSFGLIRQVAVLPDGRFAVADAQAEEIRLFDPEGEHLRTFGGEGAGPGELRGLQGVHLDHRGLLRAAEQRNGRLSVFHPDTGFVTSHPLRLFSYQFRGPWRAAVDSAGRTRVESSGSCGEDRYCHMIRVYDPSMVQLDSIPYHDYTDEVRRDEDPPGAWRIRLERGWTFAPVPFYAQEQQVLAPTGELWSTEAGATELAVYRWEPAGDTSLVVVSERAPAPVTAAERDSAMAAVRAELAERAPDAPHLPASRVPSTRPPAYALSLDDRGRLWVRLTGSTADSTAYDVFTPGGRHAETVALPFRVDVWIPPVVRGDTLWAVVTDDLDVQHVVRARLRDAGPPPG